MKFYDKMIPSPKFFSDYEECFSHNAAIGGDFEKAIEAFKKYARKALELDFTEGNDFTVISDGSLDEGEYTVISTEGKVEIRAGGSEGASYALASLIQLMKNKEGKAELAAFEMHDNADNDYRGLMIDCARNHHPLSLLKKYIDLCWFYKIKYLHLHFTDNEAYTLPSKLFPLLISEHNCYTEDEIGELVSYAHGRDVQIVPEIDTPGHSAMIRRAYPELFDGAGNILNFSGEAIEAMQALYGELCRMFPHSEYIHIGADESDIMDWNKSEACVSYGESIGIEEVDFDHKYYIPWHRAERFLVHYINKIADVIIENGRKPLVWEGFSNQVNKYMNREVTVMVFESLYQLPPSYIKNGFKIINCSWRPTYVVTPSYFWGMDECYDWDISAFSAIHPDSPYYGGSFRLDSKKNIVGGQLNAWGDTLSSVENGLEDELAKIREDLPAIAENTWNDLKKGDYRSFLASHKNCEKLFDKILK